MKNTTCKNCQKKFHACSSCGLMNDWEYEYCSEDCWGKSKKYEKLKKAEDLILNNFDKKQLVALYTVFINNEPTYDFEKELCRKIGEKY